MFTVFLWRQERIVRRQLIKNSSSGGIYLLRMRGTCDNTEIVCDLRLFSREMLQNPVEFPLDLVWPFQLRSHSCSLSNFANNFPQQEGYDLLPFIPCFETHRKWKMSFPSNRKIMMYALLFCFNHVIIIIFL